MAEGVYAPEKTGIRCYTHSSYVGTSSVKVDEYGMVTVSIEALEEILIEAGWRRV